MQIKHKKPINIWLALTLSVLFFHPLIATLHDGVIFLQWRIQHSLELSAAIALFTLFFTVALCLIDKIYNLKIRFALLFLLAIVPCISFFVHFLQQLGFTEALISIGVYATKNKFLVATAGALCVATFLFLLIRYPRKFGYIIFFILLALSPLTILAGLTIWNVRHVNTAIEITPPDLNPLKTHTPKHNLIVVLFDELSYNYLYKDNSINPQYANFRLLASKSDNYHAATSPGKATISAIPGLLMTRRYGKIIMKYDSFYTVMKDNKEHFLKIEPDNIFSLAKSSGFKTFAYGTFLPYCEMFGLFLDGGNSFTIYNYATVEKRFSLLNPVMSNFILWPHQFPMGFLKNLVATSSHRKQTEQIFQKTLSTLDEKSPFFMFSHIASTHVPFVFNRNGFYINKQPFLQNADNYQKALQYTDFLVGELIHKLKANGIFESTEIVVLADHNYRMMFPGKEDQIPMIIKKPFQEKKTDIFEPVRAENVLRNIVVQAGNADL